jgi:hypothetical protein
MKPDFDVSYPPARGPVLLLSCMDLRLMDEVAQFMAHDGLANRYDHVIMAGAALGALGANHCDYEHWRRTFKDHLDAAHKLHRIKDVYILEHRDCGAYVEFLGIDGTFSDEQSELESQVHCRYAEELSQVVKQWATEKDVKITVKAFLMDLRGNVSLLSDCKAKKGRGPKKAPDREPRRTKR